ncbi:MAG: hypothetical protein ACK559_06495, partial [bacterium]
SRSIQTNKFDLAPLWLVRVLMKLRTQPEVSLLALVWEILHIWAAKKRAKITNESGNPRLRPSRLILTIY